MKDARSGLDRERMFMLASEVQRELRKAFIHGVLFGMCLIAFTTAVYVLIFR